MPNNIRRIAAWDKTMNKRKPTRKGDTAGTHMPCLFLFLTGLLGGAACGPLRSRCPYSAPLPSLGDAQGGPGYITHPKVPNGPSPEPIP